MGINHKPAPELLVPYWIDGLGSWWESALYSEAERAALAERCWNWDALMTDLLAHYARLTGVHSIRDRFTS